MRDSRIDYAHIRRVVPIEAVLARYGLTETLKRSGADLKGPCPLHGSTDKRARSFVITPQKNVWRCFSCQRAGGTVELVAELEHVDVRAAAQLIAQWFAIEPPATMKQQPKRRIHMPGQGPTHKVWAVSDREWEDPKTGESRKKWAWIGTAFETKDGYSIAFDALPVPTMYDGKVQVRVVLRPFDSAEEHEPEVTKKPARR